MLTRVLPALGLFNPWRCWRRWRGKQARMAEWMRPAAAERPSSMMMAPPPPPPSCYIFSPAAPPPPMAVAFPELLKRPLPPETYKMPEGDLLATAAWLENLCARTENAISEVKKITGLQEPAAQLVSCPFDARHRMPPHALLLHSLRCSSSTAALGEEAEPLVSSLSYLRQPGSDQAEEPFSSSTTKLWYEGAPGPVQLGYRLDSGPGFSLPACVKNELEQPVTENPRFQSGGLLLPSEFWLLSKEVEEWVDMPERYSWSVLVAALGLDRLGKDRITEWLLAHSCEHGIVLDPVLASHILVLLTPFLRLGSKEAAAGFGSGDYRPGPFSCPQLRGAGNWVATQLACLFHPAQARALVLRLLKHGLTLSGRLVLAVTMDSVSSGKQIDLAPISASRIETAVRALHERKELEIFVGSQVQSRNVTQASYVEEYDNIVKLAGEERLRRADYRPVLEHDGLVWHREKDENTSKTRTSSDVLAAERDYKRRPLSYRSKKLKRSACQVMHDIIEKHMADIVAAGGIGCFSKQAMAQEGSLIAGNERRHYLDSSAEESYYNRSSTPAKEAGYKSGSTTRMDRAPDGGPSTQIDRAPDGYKRKRSNRWEEDSGYHSARERHKRQ